jgi:hypothetical protein
MKEHSSGASASCHMEVHEIVVLIGFIIARFSGPMPGHAV